MTKTKLKPLPAVTLSIVRGGTGANPLYEAALYYGINPRPHSEASGINPPRHAEKV